MLRFVWLTLVWFGCGTVSAQDKVYRCGNEYTNMPPAASVSNCTLIHQGNVTVLPAFKVPAPLATPSSPPSTAGSDAQRSKDADARFILEAELKKVQSRHAELLKEYNNGEPEKMGAEARNHQKYLDRVQEMKANLQRNEADIASIRREIGRLGGAVKR
jgi:hypothetical protein